MIDMERTRGRPRAFDEAKFLDASIRLFSRDGFAGVSVSDITTASDLTIGSIYKAYKDKLGVFTKSLERYIALREAEIGDRLRGLDDARSKIAALLDFYLQISRGPEGRLGCMVVSGVADLDLVGAAADLLRRQMSRRQQWLVELLSDGKIDGSIGADVNVAATADLLLALLQGLRVVGKAELIGENGDDLIASALKLLS